MVMHFRDWSDLDLNLTENTMIILNPATFGSYLIFRLNYD